MDLATLQTALVTWVKGATGLEDVYMADQNGPSIDTQGEDPWATLRLAQLVSPAGGDEVTRADDDTQLAITVRSFPVLVVGLQTYSPKAAGTNSALDLAAQCRLALSLPSVRRALSVAGMSLGSIGVVSAVPVVMETKWRGRAVLELRFNVRDDVSETLGYIGSVSGAVNFTPPEDRPAIPFEMSLED